MQALVAKAEAQYGLVTRRQIDAALTRGQFDQLARRRAIVPAVRGVWRMAGTPWTWRGRVMAVCLSVGPPVAASHSTAARLWGVEGVPPPGLHVVVPTRRNGQAGKSLPGGVVVHHAQLAEGTVVERHRLPVTTTARTLVDLAATLQVDALSRVAEALDRDRHFDLGALRLERLARPRVPGVGHIDALLARWTDEPAGDSAWEDRVFRWLVEGGLPVPRRQYQVVLGNGTVAIPDFAYPGEKVAVEFDGFRDHRGRERFDHDRARLSELTADGWATIHVTSRQSAEEVVGRVRRALEARGWRAPQDHAVNLP